MPPPPSGNSGRRRRGILDYLYWHIVKYDGLKDDLIVGTSAGVVGVKPTDRGLMIILRTPSGKNCGDYSAITITISVSARPIFSGRHDFLPEKSGRQCEVIWTSCRKLELHVNV